MFGYERSELLFDELLGLSFARTTLPPKIIQLRKDSQENHVRRMKIAYQKKEIQGPRDITSYLSASVPKRDIRCYKTPFTSPAAGPIQSSGGGGVAQFGGPVDNLRPVPKANLNTFSPKVKSSEYSRDSYHTMSAKAKQLQKLSQSVKLMSDFTKREFNRRQFQGTYRTDEGVENSINAKAGDGACRRKYTFFKTARARASSESTNSNLRATKTNTTSESTFNESRAIPLAKGDEKVDGLSLFNSLNKTTTFKNLEDSKKDNPLRARKKSSSASRIPVLLSRLSTKEDNKKMPPCSFENFKSRKFSGPLTNKSSTESYAQEQNLDKVSAEEKNEFAQENESMQNFLNDFFTLDINDTSPDKLSDSKKDRHQLDQVDDMSVKMSSISKWLNSIVDAEDSGKNSSGSHLTSHENKSTPPSLRNRIPRPIFGKEKNFYSDDMNKDSGISNKQSPSSSDSEQCLDCFYNNAETDDENLQSNRKNKWREGVYEDDSTLTVPSDKDLDLANHRQNIFRSLPEYPNTPYNLRYPRYKLKESMGVFRPPIIETGEVSHRKKSLKLRRKSSIITPKRKKSGKVKRNQRSKKLISQ